MILIIEKNLFCGSHPSLLHIIIKQYFKKIGVYWTGSHVVDLILYIFSAHEISNILCQ